MSPESKFVALAGDRVVVYIVKYRLDNEIGEVASR